MSLPQSASSPCLCSSRDCPKLCPPNLGTSYLADKTVPFYREPLTFFDKHMDEDRVFVCRFAMRPCYVLASNSLVKQLLNDKSSHESYNGLKDFFFGLFGQNVMFSEAAEAEKMRQIMIPLMTPEALTDYKPIMQQLVSTWILRDLSGCDPVILYDQFKKFATMLTLKLFLGLDGEEAEEMSKLATTHWHGIISVPLNVKLSFLMSSSYRKAVHAKNQLLALIEKKLASKDSPFLAKFEEEARNGGINDLEEVKNNILLITCALIPKALASILTSFVDSSGLWYDKFVNDGDISDHDLANIFLEVVRLWPPFFGGLRVAIDDLELGNYHVPKGYGIFYGNYIAHRDPQVFPNADQFDPQRWDGANAGDQDKIFGFGSGPHRCVGENLMWDVMKFVGHKFVQTFTWDHMDNVMERNIKCLPVLRPRHLSPIILRKL